MIKERVIKVIEYKGIPKEEFYKKIGMTSANFRGNAKKTPLNSSAIENILSEIPDINIEWLITGKGKMLKSDTYELIDSGVNVPIMNIEAAAGFGSFNPSYIEPQGVIKVPDNFIKNNQRYWWVRVRGDSMAPTLHDHSLVLANELHPSDWINMKDEHVYVITNREGETYIKRIKNRLERQGELILMSDNVDRAHYPAMYWRGEDIIGVWHAEFHLTTRMDNINQTYFSRLKELEDRFDSLEYQLKLKK